MLYPSKNQIVTFAGQNPCQYQLVLNGNPVSWVNRVKYLGVHFCCDKGCSESTDFYRKFYGQINPLTVTGGGGKITPQATFWHAIQHPLGIFKNAFVSFAKYKFPTK